MDNKFAIVVMLPDPQDDADPTRVDFISREFPDIDSIAAALRELDEKIPNWRILSFCHVEDLPLLMEEPI